MVIVKLIAIFFLALIGIFCFEKGIQALLNIFVLYRYSKKSDSVSQRHGMVFNEKKQKLEADQSPILPY